MNRFLLSFLIYLIFPELTFARNIYFFDKQAENISVKINKTVNQIRKVYVFKDSEVIRKKTYRVPTGYSIETSSLGMASGYRNGDLNWNIGIPNSATLPDVLSELEWDNIDIAQFSFDGEVKFRNNFTFGLDFGFGIISDGDGRDSDYEFDNRQGEFSRSIANVGGHNVIDVSSYIGYEFSPDLFQDYRSSFTPLLGYSYHEQNIQFEEGVQVISGTAFGVTPPAPGPVSGLDSEYRTHWYGPWLGFNFEIKKGDWSVATRYSHHWADYEAEATWNLRSDFAQPVSFEHIAKGQGNKISITLTRHWHSDYYAFLDLGMETWDTDEGIDRTFLSNGNVATAQLNDANWDSWWAGIGIKRYF